MAGCLQTNNPLVNIQLSSTYAGSWEAFREGRGWKTLMLNVNHANFSWYSHVLNNRGRAIRRKITTVRWYLFRYSELPMNRRQMLARAHADAQFQIRLFSEMIVFWPALCEAQTTTQAAVGGICLPSTSRKFYWVWRPQSFNLLSVKLVIWEIQAYIHFIQFAPLYGNVFGRLTHSARRLWDCKHHYAARIKLSWLWGWWDTGRDTYCLIHYAWGGTLLIRGWVTPHVQTTLTFLTTALSTYFPAVVKQPSEQQRVTAKLSITLRFNCHHPLWTDTWSPDCANHDWHVKRAPFKVQVPTKLSSLSMNAFVLRIVTIALTQNDPLVSSVKQWDGGSHK